MGTLLWTAPEVLKGRPSTEGADVYAFGVVLWEILHWSEPYVGKSSFQVAMDVAKGGRPAVDGAALDGLYGGGKGGMGRLMEDTWAAEPLARPSFVEILQRLDGLEDEE